MAKFAFLLVLLGLLATMTVARQFDDIADAVDDAIDLAECIANAGTCAADFSTECIDSDGTESTSFDQVCGCIKDWIACIDSDCELPEEVTQRCEDANCGEEVDCNRPATGSAASIPFTTNLYETKNRN
ncbi:hypothetical protein QOT17_014021 [Balamuthia mandrillaris]